MYQRNTKEGGSVILSISKAMISCQAQLSTSIMPGARLPYSSQGGSISTTSNFVPKVSTESGSCFRSACARKEQLLSHHREWRVEGIGVERGLYIFALRGSF